MSRGPNYWAYDVQMMIRERSLSVFANMSSFCTQTKSIPLTGETLCVVLDCIVLYSIVTFNNLYTNFSYENVVFETIKNT